MFADFPIDQFRNNWILFLLQILALFHISLGQQLNLYWVHKVLWNNGFNEVTYCLVNSLPHLASTDRSAGYTAHHHLWCRFCWWHMGRWVGHPACLSAGLHRREIPHWHWSTLHYFTLLLLFYGIKSWWMTIIKYSAFFFCSQSTAPFLHIGALVTFTAMSWLIAGYVVRKERSSKYNDPLSSVIQTNFCLHHLLC